VSSEKFPDSLEVGIRAHDMHHGLIRRSGGLFNVHMTKTKIVGSAAQLCTVIKDAEVIENYHQLEASAGELGMDDLLLEKSLEELEQVEFVRLKRAGGKITRVDVTVPLLGDIYRALGARWADLGPTEIEKASIQLLDTVSVLPTKTRDIQNSLGLDPTQLEIIRTIGINAGYLGEYKSRSDGEMVLYSPLHWEEHPRNIEQITKKFSASEIVKALRIVRKYPGLPAEEVSNSVLNDAVKSGLLPTPSVVSTRGKKQFLFTPIGGMKAFEKSIVEKARAIIACVRYGEVYGTITKVRDPLVLLMALKDRKYLNPHTEALRQYETLRNLGVGRIERDRKTGRYSLHLIDNDDNIRALELAIQLLQTGEPTIQTEGLQAAKQLLLPGSYLNPTATRSRFANVEPAVLPTRMVEYVNDVIRGANVDFD